VDIDSRVCHPLHVPSDKYNIQDGDIYFHISVMVFTQPSFGQSLDFIPFCCNFLEVAQSLHNDVSGRYFFLCSYDGDG
jgi:hypothetical protein